MVFENQNVCCLGKIRSPDEEFLCVQDIMLDTNAHKVTESEITLNTRDIYKDLRAVGYDYGPLFRGLKSIKTNDFQKLEGQVEWEGNWVTFMDALLQTMALAMPFRRLMVPVMFKRLRCDPKVLYEAIVRNKVVVNEETFDEEKAMTDIGINDNEESKEIDKEFETLLEADNKKYMEGVMGQRFHIYSSILPFHVNMNSRMIVSYGVEIEDLMALPIPRKTNVQDLRLESYQFLANEDMNAIEESYKRHLLEYLKVCSGIASNAKKILESDEPIDPKICSEFDSHLKDIKDNEVLLKILEKLHNTVKDENRNFDKNTINRLLTDLQTKPEYDMSKDVLNQVSKNEHLIRSLLDIVSENYVPKRDIKVLEINLTNALMAEEVDNQLASSHIYPIDVNYTIAVKSLDSVPENLKSFKAIEWDHKNTHFPFEITSADLIVMKDNTDLSEVKLEDYLQEVYDVIVSRGFLISVFRCKYTEPELLLNSMNGKKILKDSDLEKRIVEFTRTAQNIGFSLIGRKSDSINSMAFLFRKADITPEVPKEEDIIEISSGCLKWFESVKQQIKENKEREEKHKIWLIARDSPKNGIIGLINCLRLEPGGETLRCLFDCNGLTEKSIDFNGKPFSDILLNDLAINVLKDGTVGTYRHLTLPKDYDKIKSEDYFLNVGQTRDLSNLQWYDSKNIISMKESYDLCNKYQKRVKCEVYSSGLNFKDVMLATGMSLPKLSLINSHQY